MVQITSPATADQYMITIDSRVKAGKSKIGTDNKGIVCMGNLENDYKEMAKAFNELSDVLKEFGRLFDSKTNSNYKKKADNSAKKADHCTDMMRAIRAWKASYEDIYGKAEEFSDSNLDADDGIIWK